MKQWGVNYWEMYAPVVNQIGVISLLKIESIHESPSISIYFLLAFPQLDLYVDFFVEFFLGMVVDVKRGKWVLKLNK